MRRIIAIAVVALTAATGMTNVQADGRNSGPCTGWRHHRGGMTRDVIALIGCVEHRWSVPGGKRKMVQVGRCESSLRPHANETPGVGGLFQHKYRYWPGRARRFTRARWFGGDSTPSIFNGRANTIVTARYVRRFGWRAWTCA